MSDLSKEKCEACHAGAPRISDADLKDLMPGIPDWGVVVVDDIMRMSREFSFKNLNRRSHFQIVSAT